MTNTHIPGYQDTLNEVRRISAGGTPRRKERPRKIIHISANRIQWWANDYVVGLLGEEAA